MKTAFVPLIALIACLTAAAPVFAQTTTYDAPTGNVSSTLDTTMNLTGGGTVSLNPVVGPNCYYGMVCGFPAGYVGTYMSYSLPDGSVAQLNDFSGTFAPVSGEEYAINGQATGVDSLRLLEGLHGRHSHAHLKCADAHADRNPHRDADTPADADPATLAYADSAADPDRFNQLTIANYEPVNQ